MTDEKLKRWRTYSKCRRDLLKAEGLCTQCGKLNNEPRYAKCKDCREYQAAKSREYRKTPEGKAYGKKRRTTSLYREYQKSYGVERYSRDVQFKLTKRLRIRLLQALNGNFKNGSAIDNLGCSVEELKSHLESQFEPGMSWENHGHGNGKWNIDHIRPLASFDLTDPRQVALACHYTNLQPLWYEDNVKKGASIESHGRFW